MRPLVAALAGAACWFAVPASGQPSETGNAALNWSRLPGAEACPDLAELARRIAAHLKRDAFASPTKATVLVDASIQPVDPGFLVRIVLSSRDQATPGERALTSRAPDCNEAVDSAALAIALMLDPEALTRTEPPAPTPEPSASPPATAASAAPALPVVEPAKPAPVAFATPPSEITPRRRVPGPMQLAAGTLGSHDQVPGTSFGVLAGLRRVNHSRSLGVDLGLTYLVPRRLEMRTDTGGRFSLLAAGLSGVWSPWRSPPMVLSLLAGPQVGRMFASGFGFTRSNRDVSSWLVSGTLECELAFALSDRSELLLRLGLGVPFWRDTFEASVFQGTVTILEPAPFFGTFKMAVAFSP